MSEARTRRRRWRPWIPPLVGLARDRPRRARGRSPPRPVAAAYQATADSNETAFEPPCMGWDDPHPERMLALATSGLAALGYDVKGYKGSAFTRAHVLSPDGRRLVVLRPFARRLLLAPRRPAPLLGLPRGLRRLRPVGRLLEGHQGQAGRSRDEPRRDLDVRERRRQHDDARRLRDREVQGEASSTGTGRSSTSATSARPSTTTRRRSRSPSGSALKKGKGVGPAFDLAMLEDFTHSSFDADWWGSYVWSGTGRTRRHLPVVRVGGPRCHSSSIPRSFGSVADRRRSCSSCSRSRPRRDRPRPAGRRERPVRRRQRRDAGQPAGSGPIAATVLDRAIHHETHPRAGAGPDPDRRSGRRPTRPPDLRRGHRPRRGAAGPSPSSATRWTAGSSPRPGSAGRPGPALALALGVGRRSGRPTAWLGRSGSSRPVAAVADRRGANGWTVRWDRRRRRHPGARRRAPRPALAGWLVPRPRRRPSTPLARPADDDDRGRRRPRRRRDPPRPLDPGERPAATSGSSARHWPGSRRTTPSSRLGPTHRPRSVAWPGSSRSGRAARSPRRSAASRCRSTRATVRCSAVTSCDERRSLAPAAATLGSDHGGRRRMTAMAVGCGGPAPRRPARSRSDALADADRERDADRHRDDRAASPVARPPRPRPPRMSGDLAPAVRAARGDGPRDRGAGTVDGDPIRCRIRDVAWISTDADGRVLATTRDGRAFMSTDRSPTDREPSLDGASRRAMDRATPRRVRWSFGSAEPTDGSRAAFLAADYGASGRFELVVVATVDRRGHASSIADPAEGGPPSWIGDRLVVLTRERAATRRASSSSTPTSGSRQTVPDRRSRADPRLDRPDRRPVDLPADGSTVAVAADGDGRIEIAPAGPWLAGRADRHEGRRAAGARCRRRSSLIRLARARAGTGSRFAVVRTDADGGCDRE